MEEKNKENKWLVEFFKQLKIVIQSGNKICNNMAEEINKSLELK